MKNFFAWVFGCKPEHLKYQIVTFIIVGALLFAFTSAAHRLADLASGRRCVDDMIRYSKLHDGVNYVGTTKINGRTYNIYVEEG